MRKFRLKTFENFRKLLKTYAKRLKNSAKRLKIFENFRIFVTCGKNTCVFGRAPGRGGKIRISKS